MVLPLPAALVVAHPGHELRLFHWLELDRPTVFVLTDGSGRSGRSRLESTRAVLAATGCAEGSVMGRFTDREIYRAILERDVREVANVTRELSGALATFRTVVCDAMELYNPAHDLCHVITSLAAPSIERFAYSVVDAPGDGITLTLDDDAYARKIAMAHRYDDLATDIDELTSRIGNDALRREVFSGPAPAQPNAKPYYEVRGEEQVRAGKYQTVLRYREHFLPFVKALTTSQQPEDE